MATANPITTRRCSKCGEVKPLAEMVIDRSKKSGYSGRCKGCALAAARRWYESVRERRGIKPRVEHVDPRLVRPDTPILDEGGRDWTWAFAIFREPAGFPGYLVGSDGGVWSQLGITGLGFGLGCASIMTGRWRRKKHAVDQDGYHFVNLRRDGKTSPKKLARLVLETFVGPCPEGMEACHNNGIRTDNRLCNLRWDTPESNLEDRDIRHGTTAKGERGGNSVVTTDIVLRIRDLSAQGMTYREISRSLPITESQVARIAKGLAWKHVASPQGENCVQADRRVGIFREELLDGTAGRPR